MIAINCVQYNSKTRTVSNCLTQVRATSRYMFIAIKYYDIEIHPLNTDAHHSAVVPTLNSVSRGARYGTARP